MSYTGIDDKNLIDDLVKRKEFYWTKRRQTEKSPADDIIPRFVLDESINKGGYLRLLGHQQFVSNFMNPHTDYKRLHIKWSTGSGKTIAGLAIAMNFIDNYRMQKELGHEIIGSVFIIGFSERQFKNELLRYPEFGFLSHDEKSQLEKLKRVAASGAKADMDRLQDFVVKIKKRFSNRKGNGFFRFYGYKAFVNRIFVSKLNINELSEEQIRVALADGRITYNTDLLAEFKNSIIISDEIHNVYNSAEKNNWGIALQAVLDKEPSVRFVSLSATPLNNSPAEIIDLLNLLLPQDQRVERGDFFLNDKDLKPGALDKIAKLSRGRFSFLIDINTKYYPSMEMVGQSLKEIPYLKFIRCPMSPFQYRTYKHIYTGALSQDSQYIVDFAIENPEDLSDKSIGIFQTSQIKRMIPGATQKFKDKYGIEFLNGKLLGDMFIRENLKRYSSKYVAVLDAVLDCIKNDRGKVFIYHNIVHMSGVLFAEQVLLRNGFIDEFSTPNDETICMKCGKTRKEHLIKGRGDIQLNRMPISKTNKKLAQILGGYQSNGMDEPMKIERETVDAPSFIPEELVENVMYGGQSVSYVERGHKIELEVDGQIVCTLHRKAKPYSFYYVPSISNQLAQCEQKFLDAFASMLGELDQDLVVRINVYASKFFDYLTGNKFILVGTTTKHIILLKQHDISGGAQKKSAKKTTKKPTKQTQKHTKSTDAHAHQFTPARFVMAHSDVEKSVMEHSLEKFNSVDNLEGEQFYILVGSKIIKESYDLKAIRNVFVVGRPDNIPTFIQIRGRAVRKNSHKGLSPEKQNVIVKIFTSCLPEKQETGLDKGEYKLSYEEEKYKEKVFAFKTIQVIEKAIHENAIDSLINHERSTKNNNDPLGVLPFKPNIKQTEFAANELNLSTFNIYYRKQEIQVIKQLIKRLFIEVSSVWEIEDLFKAILEPPLHYEIEIDTQLFNKDNFLIALDQLLYHNTDRTIEPFKQIVTVGGQNSYEGQILGGDVTIYEKDTLANQGDLTKLANLVTGSALGKPAIDQTVIDRLHDDTDKLILIPGGQSSVIVPIVHQKVQYLILFPINQHTQQPDIDIELPYRITPEESQLTINMNSFVQTKRVDFDYAEKKKIFFRKYADVQIENMENVICEYGSTFHIKFIEECIEYVFNTWTNPNARMAEMHEFYFKMLYYYDLLSLVMFAHTTKPRIFKEYTRYAIPVRAKDIKLKAMTRYEKRKDELVDISPQDEDLATSGVINLLKSTYNRTSNNWIPQEFREQYNKTIEASVKLFSGRRKKAKNWIKVSADLLPIGHYITKFPRLYHPEKGWDENPTYLQNEQEFIENNMIVGFDERSNTGVHIRFKIRNPIHNIKKHKDSRETEKGTVCKSKSKEFLMATAKKLDIVLPDKVNVDELCMLIRSKLIRLELKERIKKSKVKYFYFHYEARPETR
jgi:hypothetical protein